MNSKYKQERELVRNLAKLIGDIYQDHNRLANIDEIRAGIEEYNRDHGIEITHSDLLLHLRKLSELEKSEIFSKRKSFGCNLEHMLMRFSLEKTQKSYDAQRPKTKYGEDNG